MAMYGNKTIYDQSVQLNVLIIIIWISFTWCDSHHCNDVNQIYANFTGPRPRRCSFYILLIFFLWPLIKKWLSCIYFQWQGRSLQIWRSGLIKKYALVISRKFSFYVVGGTYIGAEIPQDNSLKWKKPMFPHSPCSWHSTCFALQRLAWIIQWRLGLHTTQWSLSHKKPFSRSWNISRFPIERFITVQDIECKCLLVLENWVKTLHTLLGAFLRPVSRP